VNRNDITKFGKYNCEESMYYCAETMKEIIDRISSDIIEERFDDDEKKDN